MHCKHVELEDGSWWCERDEYTGGDAGDGTQYTNVCDYYSSYENTIGGFDPEEIDKDRLDMIKKF
jgi:hypothetical protein